MGFTLLHHPAVLKNDLSKIPADLKPKIRDAIELKLKKDPILAGKPLRSSLRGHRKFRYGDWRIIYRIDKKDIIILKIGHRREVYKTASRREKR
ncbi:type II toxin-antitoxin system RelE/ParE family toxin [Candidatus Omnitrophota bacterium]